MGGTFDPIHWAHLIMAEEARKAFKLDKVLFIPSGQPPHKATYAVSNPEHRYAMTLLSTADNPNFEVSRIEIDRAGLSYSVDTIRELLAIYGPDTSVHFIIGADEALDIVNWHEAQSLPDLARFLVAPREGFSVSDLEQKLPARFAAVMDMLPTNTIEISSTAIRQRVASGESIRYLVTDSVETYIRKNRLYEL